MVLPDPDRFLRSLFDAAVAAADPAVVVPAALPASPAGRTVVVGAGKAAAGMARAVEDHWTGPLSGLVATRYGSTVSCERIEVAQAAHPVPDEAGVRAATRMLELVEHLDADDLVLVLASGGGSALLTLPVAGVSLAEVQRVNRALLRAGAPIGEFNLVRRHLSAVAGGRLAAAARPAPVCALLMSDVPGDDPAVIASGPASVDDSDPRDALLVLDRYGVDVPTSVRERLNQGSDAPSAADLAHVTTTLVATPSQSLAAAADTARASGVHPVLLGDAIEGDSRAVAAEQARLATDHGYERPCVLLSGGETTVTVRGNGVGGTNAEFALAAAIELDGAQVWGIACDTDGVDGAAEIAGAVFGPDTLARARRRGLDPHAALADNDAHTFFAALGDGVVTGPTGTNVNDFRALLLL